MNNTVLKAVKACGEKYFKNAYSPIFGLVNIVGIDKMFGEPMIKVEAKDGQVYYFYGDGRYNREGECMLFPSAAEGKYDWDKYVTKGYGIIDKMKDTSAFTEDEIEMVKNGLEEINKKPLSYYVDENKEQEIIDGVLESMEFDTIHKAMKAVDWSWWNTNGTPTPDEIKANVLGKLIEVFKHKDETEWFISSGGVEAGFRTFPNESGKFEDSVDFYVRFVVDSYETL